MREFNRFGITHLGRTQLFITHNRRIVIEVLDKTTTCYRGIYEIFDKALAVQVFEIDPDRTFLRHVRPVKEHVPIRCKNKQVDGAFSKWSVFLPQNGCQCPGLDTVRLESGKGPFDRAFHESLKTLLVHHVPCLDSGKIGQNTLFRIGNVHVEAAHQDEITRPNKTGCISDRVSQPVRIIIGIIRIIPGKIYERSLGVR